MAFSIFCGTTLTGGLFSSKKHLAEAKRSGEPRKKATTPTFKPENVFTPASKNVAFFCPETVQRSWLTSLERLPHKLQKTKKYLSPGNRE